MNIIHVDFRLVRIYADYITVICYTHIMINVEDLMQRYSKFLFCSRDLMFSKNLKYTTSY